MPVNPNEAPDGTKAVLGDECEHCVFRNVATYVFPSVDDCCKRKCTADRREDGCGVHFVAVSVPATASWPHDDMGTPV